MLKKDVNMLKMIGLICRSRRTELKLRQADVAEACHVTRPMVSKFESGVSASYSLVLYYIYTLKVDLSGVYNYGKVNKS